jgi:ankyrin repeat protein
LLENGADVELPDNYGQSPLFMACWKGEKEILLNISIHEIC